MMCDFFRKCIAHIKSDKKIIKVSDTAPWLYFSYLPEAFSHKTLKKMTSHQNMWETIKMVEVFNELGFNVYLQNFTSPKKLPNIFPDVILGLEPNFNRACEKWPKAKKIYFATGAYWQHANNQITYMTNYINNKYESNVAYQRMTFPHNASQIADQILQIGSSYTINTYPKDLQHKITLIDQSSQGKSLPKSYSPQNNFFFMGSRSNVLKGVALLLEFFCKHPELTLHWVGPIDRDFYRAFRSIITPNIYIYDFVYLNSDSMAKIVSKCNFLIYPSGTEGCPGAVINSMKMGLVPIVTPWAAFDGIESLGYVMKDWSIESVEAGVNWALSLSKDEVENLSSRCREAVCKKFNLDRFAKQLKQFMQNIIDDNKNL